MLRIEDIDIQRCRDEYLTGILDDLVWLGLAWDGDPVVQTTQAEVHATALARLQTLGVVYPCVCTRAEIAASQSAPHGDAGSVYPGTCRTRLVAEDDARPVALRLDIARAVEIAPGIEVKRDDVVVSRKGLGVAYNLAVVVDDAAAGVTDVVRGLDLLAATPVQQLLHALLDLPQPRYHHHRLIAGPDGVRLAKRTPGATLAEMRENGVYPTTLTKMLRSGELPSGFGWVL